MRIAVIGLGIFGRTLALQLHRNGAEVIAIDRDRDLVASVAGEIDDAIVLDITDGEKLQQHGLDGVDCIVVAIGEDPLPAVMITAIASDLGIPRIIARANSKFQERVLLHVGATETFSPEGTAAEAMAQRIRSPGFVHQLPLDDRWQIRELIAPEKWCNSTLADLRLRQEHELTLLAIAGDDDIEFSPGGERLIAKGERLFLLGPREILDPLIESASQE